MTTPPAGGPPPSVRGIRAKRDSRRRVAGAARPSAAVGELPADPRAVIVARGLTKRYGDFTAVDHLDLDIRPGEVFGLLGPNGAGKTTTVLMLLGLSEPTSGTARVVGLDPARQPLDVKSRVGYLPDNVGFFSAGRLIAQGRLDELAGLAGGGRLTFEVGAEGDQDDVERVLRTVSGVRRVARDAVEPRWIVVADTDVAASLTAALAAAGHPVVHLRRRGEDLLEIYRHLVPEET